MAKTYENCKLKKLGYKTTKLSICRPIKYEMFNKNLEETKMKLSLCFC